MYYQRKLYAFLNASASSAPSDEWLAQLSCWDGAVLDGLSRWWQATHKAELADNNLVQSIAASSDRVNLPENAPDPLSIAICHPISGKSGTVSPLADVPAFETIPVEIRTETSAEKVFRWFWRFYPELWLNQSSDDALADGLLYPAHRILPDCPLHSYQATVSALTGALFPEGWQNEQPSSHPYLLIFTFSPIQDFIKASRKFLDFWAGSYLLHYLSARLCWHIAETYGPDAIIVPSLWSQDIIDAFWIQDSDDKFKQFLETQFRAMGDRKTPVDRFSDRSSSSLSTAGFPNVITALVPGKEKAKAMGQALSDRLQTEWTAIGEKVRNDIRDRISRKAMNILNNDEQWQAFWAEMKEGLPRNEPEAPYRSDLRKWASINSDQFGNSTYPNWEWCKLWNAQLKNAWEPYWAAVPLGDPQLPLEITKTGTAFDQAWKDAQQNLSQAWIPIPSRPEEYTFDKLNVGTWWGSFQQRLRMAIQAVKNTRTWTIPVVPGERSTISGQYSAVHPNLNYGVVNRRGSNQDFREGAGVPEGSMRLFWLLMSNAYIGLFNGSERLNALELTKRMAWQFGSVAKTLGIHTTISSQRFDGDDIQRLDLDVDTSESEPIDYEQLVRFPNLSSIAAARFVHDEIAKEMPGRPRNSRPRRYWNALADAIRIELGTQNKREMRRRLASRTRCRAFQVPKTDQVINQEQQPGQNFNGVMFSSKWLADDMGLEGRQDIQSVRRAVQLAHQKAGFGDGSPSDWWAVVLADGDSMGQYISGSKLETYDEYLVDVDTSSFSTEMAEEYRKLRKYTKKRMGPATHIGLNRALLDFSNRLVPYLTEKRFCGKVIYSGGDDVMAVLPLEDLPGYLRSLRAAWSGQNDPEGEFKHGDDYWKPLPDKGLQDKGVPNRPLFTMGHTATMSIGVVIAYKTVPLPTVLEHLWTAEGDRAKAMAGKDGLCFRVIYGGGNTLEAMMKGELLEHWWNIAQHYRDELSPLLYRLAEELPKRVDVTHPELFSLAARVIMSRRDDARQITEVEEPITQWLSEWAKWAHQANGSLGATPEELGYLLRFTAFWIDKMVQRKQWKQPASEPSTTPSDPLVAMGGQL